MVDAHSKINRPAAHLTIFNIVLLRYGAVDKNFDQLPAIGTLDILRAKLVHAIKTLLKLAETPIPFSSMLIVTGLLRIKTDLLPNTRYRDTHRSQLFTDKRT